MNQKQNLNQNYSIMKNNKKNENNDRPVDPIEDSKGLAGYYSIVNTIKNEKKIGTKLARKLASMVQKLEKKNPGTRLQKIDQALDDYIKIRKLQKQIQSKMEYPYRDAHIAYAKAEKEFRKTQTVQKVVPKTYTPKAKKPKHDDLHLDQEHNVQKVVRKANKPNKDDIDIDDIDTDDLELVQEQKDDDIDDEDVDPCIFNEGELHLQANRVKHVGKKKEWTLHQYDVKNVLEKIDVDIVHGSKKTKVHADPFSNSTYIHIAKVTFKIVKQLKSYYDKEHPAGYFMKIKYYSNNANSDVFEQKESIHNTVVIDGFSTLSQCIGKLSDQANKMYNGTDYFLYRRNVSILVSKLPDKGGCNNDRYSSEKLHIDRYKTIKILSYKSTDNNCLFAVFNEFYDIKGNQLQSDKMRTI